MQVKISNQDLNLRDHVYSIATSHKFKMNRILRNIRKYIAGSETLKLILNRTFNSY